MFVSFFKILLLWKCTGCETLELNNSKFKIAKSLSPQVASISSLSTFHNDAVLWCSTRPIHHSQLALRYLHIYQLFCGLLGPKFQGSIPLLMKNSFSRLPLPYLPPVIKLYHFFFWSPSPSLVWKDIAQWWRYGLGIPSFLLSNRESVGWNLWGKSVSIRKETLMTLSSWKTVFTKLVLKCTFALLSLG